MENDIDDFTRRTAKRVVNTVAVETAVYVNMTSRETKAGTML